MEHTLDLSHSLSGGLFLYWVQTEWRKNVMELHDGMGSREIKGVIEEYAEIGAILDRYEIGCIKCSVGTCLLKEVVAVHFLGEETEAQIEKEINEYLAGLKH